MVGGVVAKRSVGLSVSPDVLREGDGVLLCPVCGFECVHPIGVVINAGGDITAIDSTGRRTSSGRPAGRGVRIAHRFACEDGHEFGIAFHFNKGSTVVEVVDCGPLDIARIETIWRD